MDYTGQDTTKVHVWIGDNFDENYHDYFELDYDVQVDIDSPDYKVCGFCEDIDEKWYDEDWLGAFQHSKSVKLDKLLEELAVTKDVLNDIKHVCKEKKINKASATFWYYDGSIIVKNREKKFNNLHYIGVFDTELL
ncbi:MAG: immunity 22 family protein [Defluviitaleaceae bacterium]|nr:immunity 22 family protein [Defluviitaleaceae bacterium]